MGGSSKSSTDQTSSNTINPMQMQQYQDNYAQTQNRVASLTPYTGQLTAGFNNNQLQAQSSLSDIAADPRYQAANNAAINSVQNVLGTSVNPTITPKSVSAAPYTAAQLAGTDLTPYMNPYQDSVINASIAQNHYARNQQAVTDNATATAANAFGGTRQAVQRAQTTAAYDMNDQQNIAALNAANFNQAQVAAGSDIAARNAASQFNATQGLNASQFNASQDLTAQQNSFANTLAALGLTINAAGQLSSLNSAGLGLATQQAGILSGVGDAQQAQQQKDLDNAYTLYLQNQQLSLSQQQLLNQSLGLIPVQQTNQTNGTTTSSTNPGALGILGGIGKIGMDVPFG